MNLQQIAQSGQCFRMHTSDEKDIWVIQSAGEYLEVRKEEEGFLFSCNESDFWNHWAVYFDLSIDYGWIKEQIDPEDIYLSKSIEFGGGIRILRQELWEIIITFLISQNNNINRITKSVDVLCKQFGTLKLGNGFYINQAGECFETQKSYYSFPKPAQIVEAGLEGLSTLGLGYRNKYIYEMAKWCSSFEGEEWMLQLYEADYQEACSLLKEQYGIGQKVAECICLYGLHHIEAFPVDTHINQILKKYYINGFPLERYKGYAGVLQQYMFYFKTNNGDLA